MRYLVKVSTKSFNKPGLSPTVKNGTDMGWVGEGFTFVALSLVNGWLSIAANKWVMLSACEAVTVDPPPVDPPPVDPPASADVNVNINVVDQAVTIAVNGAAKILHDGVLVHE